MWTLIKAGGDGMNNGGDYKELMLDEAGDIASEPEDMGTIAPGSIAYLVDGSKTWRKNAEGVWTLMQTGGGGGESDMTIKKLIITEDADEEITANLDYDEILAAINDEKTVFEAYFVEDGTEGVSGVTLIGLGEISGHKIGIFQVNMSGTQIPPEPRYLQLSDTGWRDITPEA